MNVCITLNSHPLNIQEISLWRNICILMQSHHENKSFLYVQMKLTSQYLDLWTPSE